MKRSILLLGLGMVVAACTAATTDPTSTSGTEQEPTTSPSTTAEPDGGSTEIPDRLQSMANAWETDFSNSTIDLDELLVGIPASDPRDMIRPIDEPAFAAARSTEWIADNEPGVMLDIEDDVRFYPLSILTRHEIVNDTVGDMPVAVTYCPLCNTAVVFDRRLDGEVLRLGVSGLLRNSDLVMWDNVSQTLWQQITGEGIVGEKAGEQLTVINAGIVRWADFLTEHPEGLAMTDNQGFGSNYGRNPYEFYSSRERPLNFFTGDIDDRFPALDRVVGVSVGDTDKAYPFSLLTDARVVNDNIEGTPIVVFWGSEDTADALDSSLIAEARGVGTGIALDPVVNGTPLTFLWSTAGITDLETGSQWSILGTALSGELEGTELELIPHRNEFWFAWQAFFPNAEVWTP